MPSARPPAISIPPLAAPGIPSRPNLPISSASWNTATLKTASALHALLGQSPPFSSPPSLIDAKSGIRQHLGSLGRSLWLARRPGVGRARCRRHGRPLACQTKLLCLPCNSALCRGAILPVFRHPSLSRIAPQRPAPKLLRFPEELRKKKDERLKEFTEVKSQIQDVLVEISGSTQLSDAAVFATASEQDLSLARFEEYHTHLQAPQEEKVEQLQKSASYIGLIQDLCALLGMDWVKIVAEVHPSLVKSSDGQSKSISDSTLDGLKQTLQSLQHQRKKRLQTLQDLAAALIELWNLMDTPQEEQHPFQHITCVVGTAEDEVSAPGLLSIENLQQAEAEVERLDNLKASKMKELVMKKQAELDEIFREAHMDSTPDANQDKIMAIIDSGLFDASELLASMDQQIADAKEEALSRKEIMDKMEKWISACEEESWLEDYNRDENRYNASRGAHINLKRAERARATIQKLPALIESLMAKTKAWEDDHGMPFVYDGMRLVDVLDEHNSLRKEREQERRRMRDQKRLQEQLMTEQETLFGSKPSPLKPLSAKKGLSLRANGNAPAGTPNRRLSLGGAMLQNGVTPVRLRRDGRKDKTRPIAPVNYVALSKEDSASLSSVAGSEPTSPMSAIQI